MSTNFYWHEKPKVCVTCGHNLSKTIHIGKSSPGWVFMLHVDPEEGLHTLNDWIDKWNEPGSLIYNEYGTLISNSDMSRIILDRENFESTRKDTSYLMKNHAVEGPRGLLRGDRNFAPPDDETYDLVDGEFS